MNLLNYVPGDSFLHKLNHTTTQCRFRFCDVQFYLIAFYCISKYISQFCRRADAAKVKMEHLAAGPLLLQFHDFKSLKQVFLSGKVTVERACQKAFAEATWTGQETELVVVGDFPYHIGLIYIMVTSITHFFEILYAYRQSLFLYVHHQTSLACHATMQPEFALLTKIVEKRGVLAHGVVTIGGIVARRLVVAEQNDDAGAHKFFELGTGGDINFFAKHGSW